MRCQADLFRLNGKWRQHTCALEQCCWPPFALPSHIPRMVQPKTAQAHNTAQWPQSACSRLLLLYCRGGPRVPAVGCSFCTVGAKLQWNCKHTVPVVRELSTDGFHVPSLGIPTTPRDYRNSQFMVSGPLLTSSAISSDNFTVRSLCQPQHFSCPMAAAITTSGAKEFPGSTS